MQTVVALLVKVGTATMSWHYYLNLLTKRGLKKVPEEKACTSETRQWGIPGNKDLPKVPVMANTIKKQADKQGISSTIYDPRIYVDNERFT